jgi:3D (Asp-Asp-Asp) domain-containing protein
LRAIGSILLIIGLKVNNKHTIIRLIMDKLTKYLKLAKNKLMKKNVLTVLLLTLVSSVVFPLPSLADTKIVTTSSSTNISYKLVTDDSVQSLIEIINPEVIANGSGVEAKNYHLPQNNNLSAKYTVIAVLTAYNSDLGQTDNSPCITANGFDVCKHGVEDTVAVNGFKMGTRVRFPDLFGEKVFVVRDRMNSRYSSGRVDVWMLSKADAKTFGVKSAKMEVLD